MVSGAGVEGKGVRLQIGKTPTAIYWQQTEIPYVRLAQRYSLLGCDAVLFDKYQSSGGEICLYLKCQHGCKKFRPRNGIATCSVV